MLLKLILDSFFLRLRCQSVECDYDLDVSYYKPIKPLTSNLQVMMISPNSASVSQSDLQLMHNGTTVVRWDSNSTHSSVCYLRLESDNRTLSWCKPTWSALRGQGTVAPPTDYVFRAPDSAPCSLAMMARYQCGPPVVEDVEDGYVDLFVVKQVSQGESSAELHLISKRHNFEGVSKEDNCLSLMFGSCLAENKYVEFVMPSSVCEVWSRGLKKLVWAVMMQNKKMTDKRINWLKEQYLQLFVQNERCIGPTPAEAIQASHIINAC